MRYSPDTPFALHTHEMLIVHFYVLIVHYWSDLVHSNSHQINLIHYIHNKGLLSTRLSYKIHSKTLVMFWNNHQTHLLRHILKIFELSPLITCRIQSKTGLVSSNSHTRIYSDNVNCLLHITDKMHFKTMLVSYNGHLRQPMRHILTKSTVHFKSW